MTSENPPAPGPSNLVTNAGPWRRFPMDGPAPDVRALSLTLSSATMERAWKEARRELKHYVRVELEQVERHAQRRGRVLAGFRPGEWPDAKVLRAMQISLDRRNKHVLAGLAVMLLELDEELERELAAALAEHSGDDSAPLPLLYEIAARHPRKTHARSAADIAWTFRDYGRSQVMKTDHRPPSEHPRQRRKPDALAADMNEAHAALGVAVRRVREIANQVELAQRITREDAATSLEAALQAAARLRDCLAEAALNIPAVTLQPAATPAELANMVAEAAEALRVLANPSGRPNLERLAKELANGRIVTKNAVRRSPLERIRSAAANEAREGLGKPDGDLIAFPGPRDETAWLDWFWGIAAADNDEVHTITAHLSETWPCIQRFLTNVDSTDWSHGSNVASAHTSAAVGGNMLVAIDGAPSKSAAERKTSTESDDNGTDLGDERTVDAPTSDAQSVSSHDVRTAHTAPGILDSDDCAAFEQVSGPTASLGQAFEGDPSTSPASSEANPAPEPTNATTNVVASVIDASDQSDCTPVLEHDLAPTAATPEDALASGSPSLPELSEASTRVELNLPSFAGFKCSHWIDQTGEVVSAPWTSNEFTADAISALFRYLCDDNWAVAILLVRGLNSLAARQAPAPDDLERAFSLKSSRWPLPDEEQQDLVARARHLLEQSTFPDDPRHRLIITLSLAACGSLNLLTDEEVEQLATFGGFSSRMSAFLQDWAYVARRFADPFATLARQLQAAGPNPLHELQRAADQQHASLQARLKDLHSAVGKKVQRTHCRAAWDEFVTEARPTFESVLAAPLDGETQTGLARLRKRATTIFERHEAKYQDRAVMDRAVDNLLGLASRVIRAASALSNAGAVTNGGDAFPPVVTQLLSLDHIQGMSDEEKWLLSLFRGAVYKPASLPTRILDARVIGQHPWLLSTWPANADAISTADTSQCIDPLTASALLLRVDPLQLEGSHVRQWLSEHAPWLLLHVPALGDRERASVEAFHSRNRDRIDAYLAALRGHHIDLAELADRNADRVYSVICEIERAANVQYQDVLLIAGWASFILGVVAEHVERTIRSVAADAEYSSGLERDEIAELVRHRRFADLHFWGSRAKDTRETGAPTRATPFRRDAESRWATPKQALSSLAQEADQPPNLRALIHDWCQASKNAASPLGSDKQRTLREYFVDVVLELTAQKRKKKANATKDAHRISCADVIQWLPNSALTPTFLPQIHRYTDMSIKVLAVSSADRSLPAKLLALGEESSLTVVLAPGMSPQLREEASRALRQSTGKPLAIIDDLDLCRLLNPGGVQPHLVEALVEVVVEQQRWNEFSPYEVQEGQHVRMEMYVGRRPEAERLVNGTTYSRIFSGRRLGKTALLRYVEHRYDRSVLPSGKTLRVLYVPIVGLGSEHEVVPEIVGKLESTVGMRFPSHGDPRARLKAAIKGALEQRPGESYLIFLDEADTFFESQTRWSVGEHVDRESSLSWVMRASEGEKDSRQLPRIRFVVCGYRATNRSEGAWGNWGDVLLLNPLEPADAVQLVTGPLARLGVDARSQADGIAFRCGYQPAVIVYVCARLLAELERRTAFTERVKRVVRAEDVVSVFQLPEVHDRVRETVWLNFVGDPLGQLTFAAFLAEAADLSPGTPIDDAPQRILSHVTRETDESTLARWIDGSWQDLGARHLRDLVKRSLLAEAEHHPPSLRLRFPHQLPILLQESPQVRIRDALARLGAPRSVTGQRSEWLVPDDVLENMRWALSDDAREIGVTAVVFGSHWTEPLLSRTGLRHRLPPNRLLERIALPEDLDAPCEHARALVGGVALLRTALQRQAEVGVAVEIARLGRCSAEAIDSYFKRVRGVEFLSPGALEKILETTGGMPLLLERLSGCFPNEATVDGGQLDAALRSVGNALPELAHELVVGRPDRQLDRRECELLVGVVAASSVLPDGIAEILSDHGLLREAVSTYLKSIHQASCEGLLALASLGAGDNERLGLLLDLGLLRRRPLGRVPGWALSEVDSVASGDALRSLVPHMLKAIAT